MICIQRYLVPSPREHPEYPEYRETRTYESMNPYEYKGSSCRVSGVRRCGPRVGRRRRRASGVKISEPQQAAVSSAVCTEQVDSMT